ncbi:Uncharacterised protein [Edwardsiella tarda]|nr:Uncharacterised protein [Edwardsiella tarda]
MVLRRLSWMVGSGAWLMPWVLLLWQWLETGRYQAALSAQAYRSWQMTVLLADAAFAGLLSLLALLVGGARPGTQYAGKCAARPAYGRACGVGPTAIVCHVRRRPVLATWLSGPVGWAHSVHYGVVSSYFLILR